MLTGSAESGLTPFARPRSEHREGLSRLPRPERGVVPLEPDRAEQADPHVAGGHGVIPQLRRATRTSSSCASVPSSGAHSDRW